MPMTSEEKAKLIVDYADDIKADRIETLDVRQKTSVADFFVICTGNSDIHANSITERVVEKMKAKGFRPSRREDGNGGWILVDYGDVVLHVMREEQRQFYDLETLWAAMQPNPDLL
ncbi:MAG: ribosome silencing factor [Chthonomonas sp.]|nr:ribosome silencing factor [Chthonomonas sp.]